VIFVDSNIPMYLIGAEHRHKIEARRLLERAKTVVLGRPTLPARDALHLAVMERHGVSRVMSFDSHFDGVPGVTRIQ
jgi:predicted nucleic acid-binding protein